MASVAPVDYTTSDAYYALPNYLSQHAKVTLACPAPPKNKRIAFEKYLAGILHGEFGLGGIISTCKHVEEATKGQHWDVVLTGVDERSLWVGLHVARRSGLPVIAVCEDHPFYSRYSGPRRITRTLEKLVRSRILRSLLRKTQSILCFIEADVLAFLGIRRERVVQLNNAVDDSLLTMAGSQKQVTPFSIGYVGGIATTKGSLDMLDLLGSVRKACPQAKLKLIGPFADEQEKVSFNKRVVELQLRDAVEVTGYVHHKQAMELLAACAVCVHLYRPVDYLYHNQVLKIAEYLALRKAVVSWDYPGARRLLNNGRAGLLINPGSQEEMAKSVVHVLTSQALRHTLEEAGHKYTMDNLVWSRVGDRALRAIGKIISRQERSGG